MRSSDRVDRGEDEVGGVAVEDAVKVVVEAEYKVVKGVEICLEDKASLVARWAEPSRLECWWCKVRLGILFL